MAKKKESKPIIVYSSITYPDLSIHPVNNTKTFNQIDLGNYFECVENVISTEKERYETYLTTVNDKIGGSAKLITISSNYEYLLSAFLETLNKDCENLVDSDLKIDESIKNKILNYLEKLNITELNEVLYDLDINRKLSIKFRGLIIEVCESFMLYYLQKTKLNVLRNTVTTFIRNGYQFYGLNSDEKGYEKFWDYLIGEFTITHLANFKQEFKTGNMIGRKVLDHLKEEFPHQPKYPSVSAIRNHLGFKKS